MTKHKHFAAKEFCEETDCIHLQDGACQIRDNVYCKFTAKELYRWLTNKGFLILKETA